MLLTFYYFILLVAVGSTMPALKFKFVVDRDTTRVVKLGARAEIDCRTDVQNAKVTLWKIGANKKVQIVSSSNVIVNNGYFYIKHAFSGYFGNYKCQAEDTLGNKIAKKVGIRPDNSKRTIAMIPDAIYMTVLAGTSFKLTCEANKPGRDTIKWEFMHMVQKPLYYSVKEKHVTRNIKQSVLEVTAARASFTGSYECQRTSKFGSITDRKQIYVHVIVPRIPSIKNQKRKTFYVSEGKPLNLICAAYGLPTPRVTWEKDGKGLTTCTKIFINVCANQPYLNTNRGLRIVSTSFKNDNGTFICKASNIAGTTIKMFDVFVTAPPQVYFPTHQILIYDLKNYPITCYASKGNPPPKFTWKLKLKMLDGYVTPNWMDVKLAPYHTISNAINGMSSTLNVPSYIIGAIYHCTVENIFGKSSDVVEFMRL